MHYTTYCNKFRESSNTLFDVVIVTATANAQAGIWIY